jgi:hypothetical protein
MLRDQEMCLSAVLRKFGLRVGSIFVGLTIAQAASAQSPPFDLLLRNARIVCWPTTRPPCLRLCPANPGNPRRNIEGESPL